MRFAGNAICCRRKKERDDDVSSSSNTFSNLSLALSLSLSVSPGLSLVSLPPEIEFAYGRDPHFPISLSKVNLLTGKKERESRGRNCARVRDSTLSRSVPLSFRGRRGLLRLRVCVQHYTVN